ncbi:MAG: hypothetical protein S4CHLAM123_11590 [Chlamydiales bacterium]|nr:hypothetical protein [Chlamydiales bacterium]
MDDNVLKKQTYELKEDSKNTRKNIIGMKNTGTDSKNIKDAEEGLTQIQAQIAKNHAVLNEITLKTKALDALYSAANTIKDQNQTIEKEKKKTRQLQYEISNKNTELKKEKNKNLNNSEQALEVQLKASQAQTSYIKEMVENFTNEAKIEKLEVATNELNEIIDSIHEDKIHTKTELIESETKNLHLMQEIQTIYKEKLNLSKQIDLLHLTIEVEKVKYADFDCIFNEFENNFLLNEIDKLLSTIKEKDEESFEYKLNASTEIQSLQKRLEDDLKLKNSELEYKEKKIKKVSEEQEESQNKITGLQKEVRKLKRTKEELEKNQSQNKETIAAKEQEIKGLTKQIEAKELELKKIEEGNTTLANLLEVAHKDSIAEVETIQDRHNTEISDKNKEISARDQQISAKNTEISAKDQQISTIKKVLIVIGVALGIAALAFAAIYVAPLLFTAVVAVAVAHIALPVLGGAVVIGIGALAYGGYKISHKA